MASLRMLAQASAGRPMRRAHAVFDADARSRPLLDPVDVVGDQPVGLSVHIGSGFRRRRLD
jgi:hypothetical protein